MKYISITWPLNIISQTLINYGQVKEKLSLVIQQRDDYCKDFNQTFAKHAEMKKNYEALRTEKDAAVKEYALVMSERDTVHKVALGILSY